MIFFRKMNFPLIFSLTHFSVVEESLSAASGDRVSCLMTPYSSTLAGVYPSPDIPVSTAETCESEISLSLWNFQLL